MTAKQLRGLLELQGYRCALTGEPLIPTNSELDHVNPRMCGGGDVLDNLQWVSGDVNRAKGTMSNEEFIAMCVAVARHAGKIE